MKRTLSRKTVHYGLLVASVLALSACSQAATTTGPAGTASGGEFHINLGGEPDTIDPNLSNFSTSIAVASQVFQGLVSYDKEMKLAPAVAKEVPSTTNGGISSDGKTLIFKLREEAKWSDGQPVRAKDFVYAIKRTLNPELAAPYATTLYDIEGAEAYNSALGTKETRKTVPPTELRSLQDAVGVSSPDPLTLVIKLKASQPVFLHLISLWTAWPVRQDIVEKHGTSWTEPPNYIGNGPFMLTKWEHGNRLEFAPNKHYYGQVPSIDKLVMVQMTDANQAYLAYQNGELDVVGVPDSSVKAVQGDASLANEILRYSELTVFGFQMNNKVRPFDNVQLRRAFALAVDRSAFIDRVAQGVGRVAYSPVMPGMATFDANLGKDYAFNPAKAKQLLAEAGYDNVSKLPPLTFTFADNSANRLRAEFFQAQMKQNLGLDVTLESLDSKAFQQRFTQSQFMIAFGGWGADFPDPSNIVPELFTTGSGNNHSDYSNPQVDMEARACQSELDNNKRMMACTRAQELAVADQPWVFLYYRERFWRLKPYVKGFQTTPKDSLPGNYFYKDISIQR